MIITHFLWIWCKILSKQWILNISSLTSCLFWAIMLLSLHHQSLASSWQYTVNFSQALLLYQCLWYLERMIRFPSYSGTSYFVYHIIKTYSIDYLNWQSTKNPSWFTWFIIDSGNYLNAIDKFFTQILCLSSLLKRKGYNKKRSWWTK